MAVAPGRVARPLRSKKHLRLIPGGAGAPSKRRAAGRPASPRGRSSQSRIAHIGASTKLAAAVSLGLVLVTVFGLVFLNIAAAEASFRLEELKERSLTEQSRYMEMRYEVANREAPGKVEEAAEKIGLVVPKDQEYLVGPEGTKAPSDGSEAEPWETKAIVQGP